MAAGFAGGFLEMDVGSVMALTSIGAAITTLGLFRLMLQKWLSRSAENSESSETNEA
jgi:hypothetical protein